MFKIKPKIIGIITISIIEINMSTGLNGILLPISSKVISGVKSGDMIVETVVRDTDNATSPFERNVITSEAVPPGTHPTRISPTVNAVFSENAFASPNAIRGIIIYWEEIPIPISLGLLNMSMKFSTFNVVPIVNNIILKSRFNMFIPEYSLKTHSNECG